MNIKSFGCSFIFGNDLADDGRDLPIPTASNFTWPALVAAHLNSGYECYARPGSGNLQIAERILSHLDHDQPVFFIIGWTWIDRFDYTNDSINNKPIQSKWRNWRTITPADNSDLAQSYYRGLHSEFRDKLSSLMCIKLVIDTLIQKRIPFLMTYMDSLLFDQTHTVTPAVVDLQNFIRPYMTQFEGQSFLEFSKKNKYPISSTLHPLEEAHRAAADHMITVFDTQKIIDPVQLAHV